MRSSGVLAVGGLIVRGIGAVLLAACGTHGSNDAVASSRSDGNGAGSADAASAVSGTSSSESLSGGTASGAGGAASPSSGSPASGAGGSSSGTPGSSGTSASASDAGAGGAGADAAGTGGGSGDDAGSGDGAPAKPSAGCGASNPPAGGGYTIDVSGTTRQYVLGLPASYDTQHPYPLVLTFHGHSYSANSVADGGPPGRAGSSSALPYYGIQSASNDGAIFVAPQAIGSGWSSDDVAFVDALVAQIESDLCVDEARVFASGFSMGAIMTITIGCAEGDKFRAIAAMSGEIQGTCAGNHPVPYWASHGMSDPTIAIANGEAARDKFGSIDGCSSQTAPADANGCVAYEGCAPGYPVVWCPFDGVHEPAPFAGDAIWSFFSQF